MCQCARFYTALPTQSSPKIPSRPIPLVKGFHISLSICQVSISLLDMYLLIIDRCFHGGSDGKESACNVGHSGLTSELGKSSGEGMGTHSSTLAWKILWTEEPGRLIVHGVTKSQTHLSH